MNRSPTLITIIVLALVLVLVAGLSVQLPQGAVHAQDPGSETTPEEITAPQALVGTSFTYQGWLTDGGSPADGEYDLRFRLYDAASGGTLLGAVNVPDHAVVAGLFTVQLDFGEVFSGNARYLEIRVRPGASAGVFTTLLPRQQLTPAPYALALPGLWTQQNPTSTNVIGGFSGNTVADGVAGAVIGGGGSDVYPNIVLEDFGTIGGGEANHISSTAGYATIGGGRSNIVQSESSQATIGGGFYNSIRRSDRATIGGGAGNYISHDSDHTTIGGGRSNSVDYESNYGTIGGGDNNTVEYMSEYATIAGGNNNDIAAGSWSATIGGGNNNDIGINSDWATIPGGQWNEANADYTFAAGRRAKANNQGCFVWGDSTNADIACNNDNRTIFRSTGGFYIYTNSGLTSGMYLAMGGSSWNGVSDRNAKENFAPVDTEQLLARLAEVPISTWNYKSQDPAIRHVGPMAQDFNSLLSDLGGEGETTINTLDADGVALAAIQGLYAQNQEQTGRIAELEAENVALRSQVDGLEARVAALEGGSVARSLAPGLPTWMLLGGLVLAGGLVLHRRRAGGAE